MTPLWPHQARGIGQTLAAVARGERLVCLASPTGGGKTRIMTELVRHYLERGLRALLLTNRNLLREQLSREMAKAGLVHGIRAAGYWSDADAPFQIASIQTERSRVLRKKTVELFPADLVLIDEAHLQANATAKTLLDRYVERGAACVGLTATPLGLGGMYDTLIQAGTNSELRECGALVAARHFGCDEPDLARIKGKVGGGDDPSEKQVRGVMGRVEDGDADERLHQLFGRVVKWFFELNPDRRPTILFGPGVAESIWFAEQFSCPERREPELQGLPAIPAAHIDGQHVWANGHMQRSTPERRAQILEMSRTGEIKVLCNRFVLREGIDAPWLSHGIFATVFGSVQTYLQSGGRLLRASRGKTEATIQDHGGHWWRPGLGSLNADRHWHLDHTSAVVSGLQEDRLRSGLDPQPVRCPRCSMVRIWRGPACPACGYRLARSAASRPVIQLDGTLKEMRGDPFRPRREYRQPDAAKQWQSMYYRARSEKWNATFAQAAALFAHENAGAWPSRALPLMPTEPRDWHRKVREVPAERLTPKE